MKISSCRYEWSRSWVFSFFPILLVSMVIIAFMLPAPNASGQGEELRLTEKTIYVPYDKLESIFDKDKRGVFLPYTEFLELWSSMIPALATKTAEKPPIDGVLVAAEYQGKVEGKVALVDAHLEFRSLKDGVALVPLNTQGISISGATVTRSIPDKPAASEPAAIPGVTATESTPAGSAFLATVNGITQAVLPQAGTYHFALRMMIPVVEEPGRKVLRFTGPKTSVSRFQMDIAEEDVEFNLQPASAFTQIRKAEGGTRLSAFFGDANQIMVSWSTQRVESGQPAVLFADVDQNVTFSEGTTRSDARVSIQILLAGLQETKLTLPSAAQVLAVNASNLKSWDVSAQGDRQTLTVQLHSPARDFLNLTVTYEIPSATVAGVRDVPMLAVEGTRRQSGNLSFFTPSTLEIRPEVSEGVTQEAVPVEANPRPAFVYRYLKTPYSLSFHVTSTLPKVEANIFTLVEAGLDRWVLQSRVDYVVKKAGVFAVEITCPTGFNVVEVSGAEKLVDDYRVVEIGGVRKLQVELGNKMEGAFSILIRAEKPWETPGTETPVQLPIPFFQPIGAEPVEGYLGVSVQQSLTANVSDQGTARAEDIRNLGNLPAPTPGLATALTLGFRYRGETQAPVVAFQRRKARVSASVNTLVEVREAFRKLTTTLAYQIDYAGVDELSLQVPASIADEIHITGDAIKERVKDIKGDVATWKVTLQTKQLGAYSLIVEHEAPYATGAAGAAESASNTIQVPEVLPLGVYRSNGYLAILKDGNLEVTPKAEGLEAIDNKELPQGLQRPDVFMAYKYDRGSDAQTKAWSLHLAVVRHAYVEVPASIVNLARLRTVITKEGNQTCEVIYELQNKRSQYLVLALPPESRILTDIFVGDTSQQPSKRESDDKILIRLGGPGDPNQIIRVRLVYEVEGKRKMGLWGTLKVTPPNLGGTKVLQTWWDVFVPKEYDYPRIKGFMQEEIPAMNGWDRWRRRLGWMVPNVGINAPNIPVSQQNPPQETAKTGSSGLDVHIVEEGKRFQLHRLAEPSMIDIQFRKHVWSIILEILAFVIAIVLGVWLVKRWKLSRLAYCVTAGVIAVVISVLVAPRAAGPWQSFYCGVLILAIVWGWRHLHTLWRNRPKPVRPAPSPVIAAPPPPPPPSKESPPIEPAAPEKQSEDKGEGHA